MGGRGSSSGKASASGAGSREITKAESDAVFDYTTSKYETINSSLREGKKLSKANASIVDNLDSAISKSSILDGTTLYRGTSPEALGINKDISKMSAAEVKSLVGRTISDNAYTSTSTNEKSASIFAGRGDVRGNVNIIYKIKGNKKGLDVGNNSNFGSAENEVILPRNALFKIVSAKRRLNRLTVVVEY